MAAYLLCRVAVTEEEIRLLVREMMPVEAEDIISASKGHMQIKSRSFLRAMKRAQLTKQCFVFAHSHPKHVQKHSPQDDEEESKLFKTAFIRIDNVPVHASIVFSSAERPEARVWLANGRKQAVERVRVLGKRFRFYFTAETALDVRPLYDRQVRAFGKYFQQIVSKLHIGIVGTGGTGSNVFEQMVRLGAGQISVFDKQLLAETNVTRVYGSRMVDVDLPKVKLMQRMAADIGLGTIVTPIIGNITDRQFAKRLRSCDIVFCCTDDQWGRSILTRLAMYYYIPVLDMGVKIDSAEGIIRSVQGRVTVLTPGAACLFCRKRIHSQAVMGESIDVSNPDQAEELRRQKYIPELQEEAPAVIPFTTTVATSAITEFAHRLTGFMGTERTATEIIHLIDSGRVATNSTPPEADCNICGTNRLWGRGDTTPFLDITWPD